MTRTYTLALAACFLFSGVAAKTSAAQKKDYLNQDEADRVRDSETPNDRIKLFLSFAADRIKKVKYVLAHPANSRVYTERLNNLIENYTNCVDDAADLIDLGAEKQQDIRPAIKDMQSKGAEFLAYLKGLQAQGEKMSAYKDNLDDAADAT